VAVPAALRPLRHKRYALIWTAGLVSNIGTWLQTVAVGSLVTGLTSNPIWTAVAYVAGFLPMSVLSPIGGALADRFDRRRCTVAGVLIEAMLAGALAVLVATGRTSPVVINLLVFVAGCVSALRMPFQQAMLPDLVPPEDLVGAVSLGSAQWNLGRVVGPAFAGIVIVAGSFSLAFTLNAISFLAVVLAFVFVRVPSPTTDEEWPGVIAQMKAGARAVRAEPGCRSAMVLVAVAAGIGAPFMALIAAMADEFVDGGPKRIAAATGALTTAQGFGSVVGALMLPSLVNRFGRQRVIFGSILAMGASLVPYALAPTVAAAVPGLAVTGGIYICVLSGLSAIVQLRAPTEFRGRAISLFWSVMSIVFPIGAFVQGVIARNAGMRATTLLSAGMLVVVTLVLRALRPRTFEALDDRLELEEVEEPERLVAEVESLVAEGDSPVTPHLGVGLLHAMVGDEEEGGVVEDAGPLDRR
jgi:MFS family permease